ncbi:MAG: amino acid ABC transporter permease [Actinobacteria bacterium]|nr:amino acid ABC transporter permease [Actinomycetota bacterium]
MSSDVAYVDPARARSRRRRARRDVLIGLGSLAAFVLVVGIVVSQLPGWHVLQDTFFNIDEFVSSFPQLISAFWLNIRIFIVAEVFILVVGIVVALARTLQAPIWLPIRVVATIYTDVFRGVPTILVILLLGFGIPALDLQGVPNSEVLWGTVALVLSYGAYVAEVFRAGLASVHPSQRMASRSLGLSSWQTNRHILLPQAVRNVVPPLLNDFISLQKDTALVSILGPIEILRRAQIDTSMSFNYTPYVAAAVIFIALTIPMTRFADWLQARTQKQRRAAATV